MNVGFITNLRAPYRTLQLNEFAKIKNIDITVYYTNQAKENRKWETNIANGFKEVDLKGIKLFSSYGYINSGILDIIKKNDFIILGGYQEPSIVYASILCKFMNKPYTIFFDGISTNRLSTSEHKLKRILKNLVIKNSNFIMANGTVGKRYFYEQFRYPIEKIYNQYLTVDSNKINILYTQKETYRQLYRYKLGIKENDKVLIYSGRLIDIKNVESVIKASYKIKSDDLVILILGGGYLEEELKKLSKELDVKVIITGFIKEQEELFKYYFVGDALILPSYIEPWGLVVNEAMFSGLPVLVSSSCGCSLDLVKNGVNGYIFDPNKLDEIANLIKCILYNDDAKKMGENSRKIISEWKFENSRKQLEKILNLV